MDKLKLALAMITKGDEEIELLTQTLKTVIAHVDGVFITANGPKTEQTQTLLAKLDKMYPEIDINYSFLEWTDDFAAQRNFNFSQISDDYTYIFWLDTDDNLVGAEHLRPLAEKAHGLNKDIVFLKYWYGCSFDLTTPPHTPGAPRLPDPVPSLETFRGVDVEHYRERLIKPGTIVWKGRLHETPVPVSGQKDNYTKVPYHPEKNPVAVMHTAMIDDAVGKLDRNRRILELQLADEGDNPDPRTQLYLMKIYAETGDKPLLEKCIEYGHAYLEKSGWDEERGTANDLMAICSTKLDRLPDAVKYLHKAIEEYPHQPLHYIRLSLAYFNMGKHREAKHWLTLAGQLDIDGETSGINNIKEMKVLFAQMLLKVKYNIDKDIPGAVEAARILLTEQPITQNHENLLFLMDLDALHKASEDAKNVLDYIKDIGTHTGSIPTIIDELPPAIKNQPWATSMRLKFIPPKIWNSNEICYYASFGGPHFEKWSDLSLKDGIGGSETAVIQLTKEWTMKGYKSVVYGDPEQPRSTIGVDYKPWHQFNRNDQFNIVILWRNWQLAPYLNAKKIYVDLHDIYNPIDMTEEQLEAVDKFFVKSEYHRQLAGKKILDKYGDKFVVIGNGVAI